MTWIVIAGLTCAVVVLFADHSMVAARINRLEQELLELRMQEQYGNHPGWRKRELDPWFD